MYKLRFFDFEVLPEWWCCTCGDHIDGEKYSPDDKDNYVTITSDDPNARDRLMSLFFEKDVAIVGYNIKHYDLIIANAIYQGFAPEYVKIISDIIINPGCAWNTKDHIRLAPFAKRKLKGVTYIDLMDDSAGSLKEKEAALGLNILESSVNFDQTNLTSEQKNDVIKYNRQDVYASVVFYELVVRPYVKTKIAMGEHFGINMDTCYASTNARLVSIILEAKRSEFIDKEKLEIALPSKIAEYCRQNLPNKILERILNDPTGFTTVLFENKVSFGNGGIHSTYAGKYIESLKKDESLPLYVESNDDYALVNVDATSYYPSMMIQFKTLSRTVSDYSKFIAIFDERVSLKAIENKTPEQEQAVKADKLVLNTTFGASGNKWLDLFDPYMCTKTCRVGQIFLASLACKIAKTINSAKIIQTNTDGILAYMLKKDLDKLKVLMDEWTSVSGINMELDEVSKIWQRDVNNYLMVLSNGKIKSKGAWLNEHYYRPGYVTLAAVNAYVCAKAAKEFLLNKTDIIESLVKNTNLFDFVTVCTKGPTYSHVVQRLKDGTEVELYKANRVIAVKDDTYGKLYKVKMYKGQRSYTMMPSTPDHCYTLNEDLSTYNFDDLKKNIDYMYYVERTLNMLDIQWHTINGQNITETNEFRPNFA